LTGVLHVDHFFHLDDLMAHLRLAFIPCSVKFHQGWDEDACHSTGLDGQMPAQARGKMWRKFGIK